MDSSFYFCNRCSQLSQSEYTWGSQEKMHHANYVYLFHGQLKIEGQGFWFAPLFHVDFLTREGSGDQIGESLVLG